MSAPTAEAARRLAAIGLGEVRVEACGHEGAVAALVVPDGSWAEVVRRGDEVAHAVRSAGFRYVTLDLAEEIPGQ